MTTPSKRTGWIAVAVLHTAVVFSLGYLAGDRTTPAVAVPAAVPGGTPAPASPPPSPTPAGPTPTGWPRQSPIDDFAVKVVKVSTAKSLSDSLYGTHRPRSRFTLVRLSLRNRTDRPAHPPSNLPLRTADGREFAPAWEPTFGQTVLARRGTFNDVNPGAATTVVYVYDLPAGARPAEVAGRRL
ncbi:DUF4352 domain-containing protein [Actinomadura craniellae]|uniref:DUF4352 domain-containing protein n=1 Tax=Actinomadura craniellae TaxID=2231787 RepID=UPI001313DE6D|nr:DUF4352 domain-containing protein [Actinomadura craniellae]